MRTIARHRLIPLAFAASLVAPGPAGAQVVDPVAPFDTTAPPITREARIDEQLGEAVPRDVTLRNSDGRIVRLGDLFDQGRPVVMVFAYHSCPMLCSLVLDGFAEAMRETGLEPGRDFTPVTVSFDPRDTPARAAEVRERYVAQAGRESVGASWRFLTGDGPETRRLARAVGFEFARDASNGEYAHPAALIFLSPDGRVVRYLYGASFPPRDFRLAVVESGWGRIGNSLDRFVLTCYRYDPDARSYMPYALGALKIGGGIFVLVLAGLLIPLWRRERARRDNASS